MTQPPLAEPPDMDPPLNPQTTRIVLCLDDAILVFRFGEASGIRALDSATGLTDDLADNDVVAETTRRARAATPGSGRVAILTALADTYGSDTLSNALLGYAFRLVARHGRVPPVRRALWGESASYVPLSAMLGATRAAFTQITHAFSDELIAEENDFFSGFRPLPSGEPRLKRGSRG